MKCEMCHKNDAKVAIHVTSGGKERELYVCRECAESEKKRKRPPRRKFGRYPGDDEDDGDTIDRHFGFPFAGDADEDEGQAGGNGARRHWTLAEDVAPCPDCGTTIEDIDHSGLLGCPYCYTAFKEILSRNVRMRGTFGGKVPNRRGGVRGKSADAGESEGE